MNFMAQIKVMALSAAVVFSFCMGVAAAEETVAWMEVIFPPGYIQEGPFKGQGYEDVVTDILQENLPEYRHEVMMGNVARMFHEFKQKKNVCNVALFKTPEREKFMHFSIPSTFTLPNRLIALAGGSESLHEGSAVSLDALLKKDVRLGVSRGRSYGKPIDKVLKKYESDGSVFLHSGEDVFQSLLKMLLKGRLDYMLGLPEEAVYVAERMGVKDKIVTFQIQESKGGYDAWLGHVACSKTDWGKRLIDRINTILLKQRPTDRYRMAYERWLDENSIKIYSRLYDDVFLKTSVAK